MSSTYQIPLVNNKPPQLADLAFYADILFDPDDSKPDYIGMNVLMGANTANAFDWKVLKFTYSGANVTRIQTAYGTWSSRVSLF